MSFRYQHPLGFTQYLVRISGKLKYMGQDNQVDAVTGYGQLQGIGSQFHRAGGSQTEFERYPVATQIIIFRHANLQGIKAEHIADKPIGTMQLCRQDILPQWSLVPCFCRQQVIFPDYNVFMHIDILPIPAFRDNYIWLMHDAHNAVVVDPGDAAPVLRALTERGLTLSDILITHHHADHTGGIAELRQHYPAINVYAPEAENIDGTTVALAGNETIFIASLQLELQVLSLPGHTRGHIGYYGANRLFCGDTLFAAGCGRLFEGTAAQMFASLSHLARLPADTQVFCTHEYTAANLQFAAAVEPGNPAVTARIARVSALRSANRPSLPSTIGEELASNPFLRCDSPEVIKSVYNHTGTRPATPVEVFTALRLWKDTFTA